MSGVSVKIEPLEASSFAPFGKIISFSENPEDERFEVLIREEKDPWRVAVFRVRIRQTERLECHPYSMETFEPMQGMGVLLCAEHEHPEEIHAFALDAPVCLYKGVWHEVVALSAEAIYKITENLEVESEFYPLPSPVEACVQAVGGAS